MRSVFLLPRVIAALVAGLALALLVTGPGAGPTAVEADDGPGTSGVTSLSDFNDRGDAVRRFTGGSHNFDPPVLYQRGRDFTSRLMAPDEEIDAVRQVSHLLDGTPPPEQHSITLAGDHVFTAKNHLMLASINPQFYGATYMDWSEHPVFGGETITVGFDIAAWVNNPARSWFDIWIYPTEEKANLPFGNPLESWLPEPLVPPQNAVHVRSDQYDLLPIWKVEVYEGGGKVRKGGGPGTKWWNEPGVEDKWHPDRAHLPRSERTKTSHEITITPDGTVKLSAPGVRDWVELRGAMNVSKWQGKPLTIVFGAHEYTPNKQVPSWGSSNGTTWHLDNVFVTAGAVAAPSPTPSPTATPSPTPGPTPTATPSPTPTATPSPTPMSSAAPAWEVVSLTAPPTGVAGQSVDLTATVRNTGGPGTVLVDIEIYDPSGARAGQRFWDNQSFAAGESRSFTFQHTLAPGASGTHVVHAGLFEPDWAQLVSWQPNLAAVSVSSGLSVTPVGGWGIGLNSATVSTSQPLAAAALAQAIAADSGRAVAQIAMRDASGWRFYVPGLEAASNLSTIPAGTRSITVLLQ